MAGLSAVILALLALGIVLGLARPKRAARFVVGLLFGPVLIGIAYAAGRQILEALPPIQKVIFMILTALAAIIAFLRIALPREVWASVMGDFVYDGLKFVVHLPFKILRLLFGMTARRSVR